MVLANPGREAEDLLRGLKPLTMESVPMSLEEAVTAYLDDRRERRFLLSELEVQS